MVVVIDISSSVKMQKSKPSEGTYKRYDAISGKDVLCAG